MPGAAKSIFDLYNSTGESLTLPSGSSDPPAPKAADLLKSIMECLKPVLEANSFLREHDFPIREAGYDEVEKSVLKGIRKSFRTLPSDQKYTW